MKEQDTRTLKAFFNQTTGDPCFPDGSKINPKNPSWGDCNWVHYHDPKTKEKKGWVEGPADQVFALEVEYVRKSRDWNKNILP